jgi:hypothetical protein
MILRITEKSDGCQQKDIPPGNSGMAEKKTPQEKWDPGQLWIRLPEEGVPPCNSGTA